MKQWQAIAQHIEQSTGKDFTVKQQQSVAGGSINAAYILTAENSQRYFVKTNALGQKSMFDAEALGLQAMVASNTIKVPIPICSGEDQLQSYIVMEYLDMSGRADQAVLGEQLAAMHKVTVDRYGWEIDNTIGDTHQPNPWQDDWLTFWREQRLGFQLKLAAHNGYGGELQRLGEAMLVEMPKLFTSHAVQPSMLHGDLWGGNVAGLGDGTPVIFDPAFYYGDREADLAMTYVFGGFGPDFYASYQAAYPVDDGFSVRKTFYNTYHIINHLNMFGGGYHGQAIHMIEQVLAEV